MIPEATVSSDWKITIPEEVLKNLDLHEGDLVAFFEREGNVYFINSDPGKLNKQYQIVKRTIMKKKADNTGNTQLHEICIELATHTETDAKTQEALECLRGVFDKWIANNGIVPPDQLSYHIVTASPKELDEIPLLIAKGADINAVNDSGETPLHCMIRHWPKANGLFENVCQMITWGSDIFIKDQTGVSCRDLLKEKLLPTDFAVLPKRRRK